MDGGEGTLRSQVGLIESASEGEGYGGAGQGNASTALDGTGLHFLLGGDGGGAANFSMGLGDTRISVCLAGLEACGDVIDDVDIGDIDGEDFVAGAAVEAFVEEVCGDEIRFLEDFAVAGGATDGRDDTLADAGDDGVFAGATDEAFEAGTDGDQGAGLEADAVTRDAGDAAESSAGGGHGDDLGVDARLDRIDDIATGEVDSGDGAEVDGQAGFLGRDEGFDDGLEMAAGEDVGFEVIDRGSLAGLPESDGGIENPGGVDAAEAHHGHAEDREGDAGGFGVDPEVEEEKEEKEAGDKYGTGTRCQ
jgi:hypothetical protein